MIFLLSIILLINTNLIYCEDVILSQSESINPKCSGNASGQILPLIKQVEVLKLLSYQIMSGDLLTSARQIYSGPDLYPIPRVIPLNQQNKLTYKALVDQHSCNKGPMLRPGRTYLTIGERLFIQTTVIYGSSKKCLFDKNIHICNTRNSGVDLTAVMKKIISNAANNSFNNGQEFKSKETTDITKRRQLCSGSNTSGTTEERYTASPKQLDNSGLVVPIPPDPKSDFNHEYSKTEESCVKTHKGILCSVAVPELVDSNKNIHPHTKNKQTIGSLPPGANQELREFLSRRGSNKSQNIIGQVELKGINTNYADSHGRINPYEPLSTED